MNSDNIFDTEQLHAAAARLFRPTPQPQHPAEAKPQDYVSPRTVHHGVEIPVTLSGLY